MKKHIGSTIALVLGILMFVSGTANIVKNNAKYQDSDLIIAGPITVLGALAYRSAKKRKRGEVKDSLLRKGLEMAAIFVLVAAVALQNDVVNRIEANPIPNGLVPIWALIAYGYMALEKKKAKDDTEDKVSSRI